MSLTDAYQIAGIVSATVALVGLIVLWVYAYDTRKLRLVAQQQLEAPITPCVVVTGNPQNKGLDGPLRFENLGVGVALNIRWRYASSSTAWNEVPALSSRDTHHASFVIRNILNHGKAIICSLIEPLRYALHEHARETLSPGMLAGSSRGPRIDPY